MLCYPPTTPAPPRPQMASAPRYLPARPLPSYAYVPGRGGHGAHPTQDPAGHSYGVEIEAIYLSPTRWEENDDYLFGVDLYNHGYLWEAHEAWEGLWQQAGHDALQATFLQGLIQCAAAALKIAMDQPRGLERLSQAGTGRLAQVAASEPEFMGLDIAEFAAAFRSFAASQPQSADERPLLELED